MTNCVFPVLSVDPKVRISKSHLNSQEVFCPITCYPNQQYTLFTIYENVHASRKYLDIQVMDEMFMPQENTWIYRSWMKCSCLKEILGYTCHGWNVHASRTYLDIHVIGEMFMPQGNTIHSCIELAHNITCLALVDQPSLTCLAM